MSNLPFDLNVASITKRYKVMLFICHIYNQVVAASVDMMNGKAASAWIRGSAAQPARFIAFKYLYSNLSPARTMHQPFTATIRGMICACSPCPCAFIRAKLSLLINGTGKCAKRLMTALTGKLYLSNLAFVSALTRAMMYLSCLWIKHLPAYSTGNIGVLICFSPLLLAYRRAKSLLSIFLDNVVRALKLFLAVRAGVGFCPYLRSTLALLIAIFPVSVVRLELFPALEACLEHN